MKKLLLLVFVIAVSSCDRMSQRIWNCSSEALPVTKVLDTGERVDDLIPAKSYIGSMKGGVQVVALENGGLTIWRRDDVKSASQPNGNACRGRTTGVVAEQF
jgi:hypothetical protein